LACCGGQPANARERAVFLEFVAACVRSGPWRTCMDSCPMRSGSAGSANFRATDLASLDASAYSSGDVLFRLETCFAVTGLTPMIFLYLSGF
jgi:hypothetical protein